MKIGFDAKRLFLNYTGLGNYSRYVVDGLSKYYSDHHYFLFSPKSPNNSETFSYFNQRNIDIIQPKGIHSLPIISSLWRSKLVTSNPNFSGLDIFHGLSNELPYGISKKIKTCVTIHDVIFLRYPKYYKPFDVFTYTHKMKHACAQADKIIAVSQQTADDIVHFFKAHPSRIVVSYQGCHERFRSKVDLETKKLIAEKYGLPHSFILNVGTVEERKNVHILIEAVSKLPDSLKMPIVIIGRKTEYQQKVADTIKRTNMEQLVQFIHRVEISDLPSIYQQARVFVYPSLFEGFGIPIIEGIESGVPVITSKGSCFSEAGGSSVIYTDPHVAGELTEALMQVLQSDNSLQIAEQKKHVQQFLPEKTAENLMRIYQSLY